MSRRRLALGDALVELIDHRGKTPKKLGGGWSHEGHRVVSAINIKAGRVDDNAHHYISPEMYKRWMKVPLIEGDVLVTSEAPTGEVAYLEREYNWALGQRVFGLRPRPGLLDGRFLYYALQGGEVRHQLMSRSTGTTVAGIRQSELVKVELDLPPILEQRAVAATLGALDDKIESNRYLIDHALSLVDALAERVAESAPTGPLGAGVALVRDTQDPSALGQRLVDHFSLPAFDAGALPDRCPAGSIMSNKLLVSGPSVLVSRLNPRIERMWWATPDDGYPALASTEFAVLTAPSELDLAGAWLAVRAPAFRDELPRRVTGTSGSHQRVRPEDLLTIETTDVRSIDQETTLAALDLLSLAQQRRRESASLVALRDTLLPELLSGQVRAASLQGAGRG